MQVKKICSKKNEKDIFGFKFTHLSEAIYAALYPKKMQSLDLKKPTAHYKAKMEEYEVLFKVQSNEELSPYTVGLLNKRNIQLIYSKDNFNTNKRQIYRKGNHWFVQYSETVGGYDGTNPRKRPIEMLNSPQRPVAYNPNRRAVTSTRNRTNTQSTNNLLLPMSPYELFPNPRQFQVYKEYKREGFQRMAFRNLMDTVVSSEFRRRTNRTPEYRTKTPQSKRQRFTQSPRTLVSTVGGYYHNRGTESRPCNSSANKVNLSSDCSQDNIFHSILAYSDSCHDFSVHIPKPLLFQVYKKNPYYKFDLDTLKVNAQQIVSSQLSRTGDMSLSEDSKTTIFLSRMNNVMNNFEDEDNYSANTPDLLKVVNPEYRSENEIGTKGPSTWEAPFLSKFYYSLFPVMDRENVYKLNVNNPNWGVKLHQMLVSENFTNYFFDMGIARKAGIEEYYGGRDLLSYIERGKPHNDPDNVPSVITQLDTIAKWWDPSSGGSNFDRRDLSNFSALLRREVIQQCGNVQFVEVKQLPNDPENTIRLIMEGMEYPETQKLYLHLKIKGSQDLYIAVLKDVFTINNCTWLYDYMENWAKIKKPGLRTIVRENETDLKLFILSLKRSGDHGQSMYLKWFNQQYINQRSFLITGDSLCAVKALYEKVPVLFFKYHINTVNSKPVLDLYFHTPSFIDKQREKYVKTHLTHVLSETSRAIIDMEEEKYFDVKYENGNFGITINKADGIDEVQINKDMNTLKLCKIYYEFKDYEKLGNQMLSKSLRFFRTRPPPIEFDPESFKEIRVSDDIVSKFLAEMDKERDMDSIYSPRLRIKEAQRRILENNKLARERFEALTRTISDRLEDLVRNTEILLIYINVFLNFKQELEGSVFEKQKRDAILTAMASFFTKSISDNDVLQEAVSGHYQMIHNSVKHAVFKNSDVLHDKNFKLFEMFAETNQKLRKIQEILSKHSPTPPPPTLSPTTPSPTRPSQATPSPIVTPSSKKSSFLSTIRSFLQNNFFNG